MRAATMGWLHEVIPSGRRSLRGSVKFQAGLALTLFLSLARAGAPGPVADVVPSDWVTVRADAVFSLVAPPGTRFVRAQGVDSLVGSLTGPGFVLTIDFGLYSSPLAERAADEGHQSEEILIQGRKARIITSYAPEVSPKTPYFIGIHFHRLENSSLGTTKLTISGGVLSKKDYAVVKKIFSSIHFSPESAAR